MKNNNNSNEAIVELWGQDFNKVKDGLDEEQIVSYVNGLMSERDSLIKRQEHLSSLSMLAERTISEADNVAKQIKDKAREKAEEDAREVVAKAEDQAKQIMEEEKSKAIAAANEEAKAIKASAQREAELLKEEKIRMAQSELKDMAQHLYQDVLSHLNSLKQQVTASEENFTQTISQFEPTKLSTIPEEINIPPVADIDTGPVDIESTTDEVTMEIQAITQTDDVAVVEKEKLSPELQEPVDYEGEVQLEILPPIEMRKIMAIISYLDSLAEVSSTELIPLADRPLVKVSLRESMNLISMLRELPEIGQAEEVVEDEQRKVQITLTEPSVLDESRRKLNDEVIHILSQ